MIKYIETKYGFIYKVDSVSALDGYKVTTKDGLGAWVGFDKVRQVWEEDEQEKDFKEEWNKTIESVKAEMISELQRTTDNDMFYGSFPVTYTPTVD